MKGKDNKQRHGDSGVAGALAWFATTEGETGPVEYETVNKRRFAAQQGAW
jgi:hypothetical protein